MKIRSWIYLGIAIIVIGLAGTVSLQSLRIRNLKEDLSYSIANEKALFAEKDSLELNNRTLLLTVDQLNYVNDSIVQKMNEARERLKIKDREIQELQYQLSEASRTDTLHLRDTIFKDRDFSLDTTKRDRWYSLRLQMNYPSEIIVTPSFTSERYVAMSLKKETVNPPKKCWIARLFQRKHKVMVVDVEEKNPYIKIKEQRYIKIIE